MHADHGVLLAAYRRIGFKHAMYRSYTALGASASISCPALSIHADHDAVSVQYVMKTVSALSIISADYHVPAAVLLGMFLMAVGFWLHVHTSLSCLFAVHILELHVKHTGSRHHRISSPLQQPCWHS